ncbi:MAG: YigZ family protein [Flavobacteriales bacterium]|nr:YigZ family protein [Flavobacteriales bacterium]
MSLMIDQYQTIETPSEGIYKEKGSKFIAFAYPVFSENEFKEKLQQLKKDYHDARHHCYAFRLGADLQQYRFSDDGEPSSTAGKPIFGQIQSFKLTNIAIIVIRYFGGTKLGVGGLITAYRAAAKDAIENANIISRTVDNVYEIQFGYEIMSDVMNFIKKQNLEVISQTLEEKGVIQFRIRQSEAESIVELLKKIEGLKIEFLTTI